MSDVKQPKSSALLALGTAALAIPGIVGKAHAAAPVVETRVDYKFAAYREADLDGDKLGGGSPARFEIDSHLFRLTSPLGTKSELDVDLAIESMSGASPWFVLPGQSGPVQVMSGASIEEERQDIQASLKHFLDQQTVVTLVGGFSNEDDYQAANIGASVDYDLAGGQRTVSAGFGYSDDHLEPTDGKKLLDRVDSADKTSFNMFVSLSQIIDARTVVQASLSYESHDGFLSDPYKKYWVVDQSNALMDSRPDQREPLTAELRLRHFVPAAGAAVHVDYRYFEDDWDIASHTVELAWYQNLPDHWQLTPSFRYYSQTQAYFYAPYFFSERGDGYGSSDYRLSPYGAISFRLKLSREWETLAASVEWESYRASADYALDSVDVESPGLVDFDILTLGLRWGF